jgi:polyhydroxybutyrate depolymerase
MPSDGPRRRRASAAALAALAALLLPAGPARSCGPDSDCPVAGGSYRLALPPGRDTGAPLPAAVFLHGWRGSAAETMADAGMVAAFAAEGVALVAADGLGGGWSFGRRAREGRDEAAYLDAVVADLARRIPLDRDRLWLAGFSLGGSMAWYLACERPGPFAAVVAVGGAFWEPLPERCRADGPPLLHLHGLADATVPLEGRRIRAGLQQGDVFAGLAILRASRGCPSLPDRLEGDLARHCRTWTGCAAGSGELRLCLGPEGHWLPEGWVARAWAWVQAVTP